MRKDPFAPTKLLVSTFLALCGLCAPPVLGQPVPGLPTASQKAITGQTLGITQIQVNYHRPLVKGREIWGELVPWGQIWRAGANENTTMEFSHGVKINGQELAAGTYGLHMIPTPEYFTVIFSKDSQLWGSFGYNPEQDALRVEVKPVPAPMRDEMTFEFTDLEQGSATFRLHWEKLQIPVRIEVATDALVLQHIEQHLASVPEDSWVAWNSAANYALNFKVYPEQAVRWIDHALALEENYRNLRIKALLERQNGDTAAFEKTLEKALGVATAAQVNTLGYFFALQKDLPMALQIFARNTADNPESWLAWASLGEAQAASGQVEEAKASYGKAHELAPDEGKERLAPVLEQLGEQSGPRPVQAFWFG